MKLRRTVTLVIPEQLIFEYMGIRGTGRQRVKSAGSEEVDAFFQKALLLRLFTSWLFEDGKGLFCSRVSMPLTLWY